MKKRGLVLGLLIMLAVVVSGFTYAFWANSVSDADKVVSGNIQVGTGKDVITEVTLGGPDDISDLVLVPIGRIADSNLVVDKTLVDQIQLTYEIEWTEPGTAAAGATGDLSITLSTAFTIGGDAALANTYLVLTYDINTGSGWSPYTLGTPIDVTLNVTEVQFRLTVRISDTVSITDYPNVAGAAIEFGLTFSVESDLA